MQLHVQSLVCIPSITPCIGLSGNQDDSDSVPDRYVGQNSIPALLGEQSPNNKEDGTDIRRDMRSILGLDTSAPFPLMSSHHLQRLARDIATELPSDREVMKYVMVLGVA